MAVGAVLISMGMIGTAGAVPCDPIEEMEYVALGDSFSAGFGQSDAGGDCSRSATKNYPKVLREILDVNIFVDVSCSGARTNHFTGTQGSAPPQFDALGPGTDIVTFSIGGNDLGFTDILQNCALDGDCRGDYGGNGMPTLIAKIRDEVGPKLEAVMRQAQSRAPNAEIFAIGYPELLPPTPTGLAWGFSCLPLSAVISDAERTSLRAVQIALNQEIQDRANIVGGSVHYVDIYNQSLDHSMCSSSPWVTQLSNLFHPSDLGHREMARILSESIPGLLDLACLASQTTTTTTTTSTSIPGSTSTTVAVSSTTTAPTASTSTTAAPMATTTIVPSTAPPTTPPPPSTPPTTAAERFGGGVSGAGASTGSDAGGAAPWRSRWEGGTAGSTLPSTGSDPMPLYAVGVSLLGVGALLTIRGSVVRRRA